MKDEERDDQGVQISPPGFNLIFIPFASDFRNLTIAETAKGTMNFHPNMLYKYSVYTSYVYFMVYV